MTNSLTMALVKRRTLNISWRKYNKSYPPRSSIHPLKVKAKYNLKAVVPLIRRMVRIRRRIMDWCHLWIRWNQKRNSQVSFKTPISWVKIVHWWCLPQTKTKTKRTRSITVFHLSSAVHRRTHHSSVIKFTTLRVSPLMILKYWLSGIELTSVISSKITSCNVKFKQRTRTNRTSTRTSAHTQMSLYERGNLPPISILSSRNISIYGKLKRNRTWKTNFSFNGISSKRPIPPTKIKMRETRSIKSLSWMQKWRCVTSLLRMTRS